MLYKDLINKSNIIQDLAPWKNINIDNIVVIEIDDVTYTIGIKNNIIKIYPDNLSSYLYLEYLEKAKEQKNIYLLDGIKKSFYNESSVYILEYIYASMLDNKMKDIYNQNNIKLNNNDLYCSFEYKNINKELEILKEEDFKNLEIILDELISLINYIDINRVNIKEGSLLFYTNNKIKFIKPQLYMVNLKNKLYFPIFEIKKNKKLLKKSLNISMRYLGPIVPSEFRIIISSYDETEKKLLTPLALNELNMNHLSMYFDSIFEKGIYQKIEVGNLMLYEILKKSLSNYNYSIDLTYINNNELFDFIYEDFERIIMINSNRKL